MSSRAEEKERRRKEREEVERREAAAAARKRRLQMASGAVLAVAAVAAVVVALVASGGSESKADKSASSGAKVPIPPAQEKNLQKAAALAGCKLLNPPSEGRGHVTSKVKYKSNPPTSGEHNPVPAEDGIYAPGNTPSPENLVHTLEHGRIEVQYRPGTPRRVEQQLETLVSEPFKGTNGYHMVLVQNNTRMPYAVAATAWTHILGCPRMNDHVFDAIRDFRTSYTDKAPEFIP